MRAALIAAGAGAALIAALSLNAAHLKHQRDTARAQARAAQARATSLETQARLSAAARLAGEARDRNTAAAVKSANEAQHDIETAPDLAAALDRYRTGLERVRASGARPVSGDHPDGG